ncbi:MAG: aminotransferase class V-fold PLP-dependent enzyme [Candidatus Polarisedimenticolaceae bacterium]|nr:aminotransferase class V-fold PLP-dependent enzyme [Candidatus Polarisedimenticolaceae bacterium]
MSRSISIHSIKKAFIGLNTCYPLAEGEPQVRRYLDSSASTLMMQPALETATAYLQHYANTHSTVHTSAKITSSVMQWAHQRIVTFLHADLTRYASILAGSGTTAAVNRIASGMAVLRPERDVVLVSMMEHHSNDLPHRQHAGLVEHIPLEMEGTYAGEIDLQALEQLLIKFKGRVNYVAVTGVSNVTGIINPIGKIAALVHRYDAYLLVDGAQMVAHMPVHLERDDIDLFVFSGHKIYAPGSPGVLVGKQSLLSKLEPNQLGGGMVSLVTPYSYQLEESLEAREEAGTPNIFGTVILACVLEVLDQIGMEAIFTQEQALIEQVIKNLSGCPDLKIYGDTDSTRRVGSIAFNIADMDHGLVAALLNDYYGIAVRNECFCAHPYVKEMLKEELFSLDIEADTDEEELFQVNLKRGMVRASFGLYSSAEDIETLGKALRDIVEKREAYLACYEPQQDGSYLHKHFNPAAESLFDPRQVLADYLSL